MGGIESGNRWRFGTRETVESYNSIDVRRWARDGLLTYGNRFGWHWHQGGEPRGDIRVIVGADRVTLDYRSRSFGEDWQQRHYGVRLERTPCNFGGSRVWFRCPALGCGRRTAKLHGGSIFACRACHRLAYASQNESAADRKARRAETIRERLGWPGGILDGDGFGKPKGMHWQTFYRLEREYDALMREVWRDYDWRVSLLTKTA